MPKQIINTVLVFNLLGFYFSHNHFYSYREHTSTSTSIPTRLATDLSCNSFTPDRVILITYIGVKDPVSQEVRIELAFKCDV